MRLALFLAVLASARKHELSLVDEARDYFIVSSFGLLLGGSITVQLSQFVANTPVTAVGFSIHRSSERSTEYNLGASDPALCFLRVLAVDHNYIRMPLNPATGAFQLQTQDVMLSGLKVDIGGIIDATNTTWQQAILTVTAKNAEDVYTVAFHACSLHPEATSVDVNLRLVEVNPGPDYLGAGLAQLPNVYGTMAALFCVAGLTWAWHLVAHRGSLFLVHHLMLVLIAVKTLSLAFHAIDYHFIKLEGHTEQGWAVTFYIIRMLALGVCWWLFLKLECAVRSKGILTFITVLLVGAGFGFIKPVLSSTEKALFVVVLALQVISSVAAIVLEEAGEGTARRDSWRTVGLLVDVLCCGAILFPLMWSIRYLEQTSTVDGKAAISVQKLKIFRKFYLIVLAYIYVTRILVYFVESVIPFRLEWAGPAINELAALSFFVTTGYMFSPVSDNPYLALAGDNTEAESIQMDEIVTLQAGQPGLKRMTKHSQHDNDRET